MFCGDTRSLHLSCSLSLVLLHQLHLISSVTGSRRLGNPSCKVQSSQIPGSGWGKLWEVEVSGNLSASHMGSPLEFVRLQQVGIRFSSLYTSQVVLTTKSLPAKAGDMRDAGLIPGWGRSPGGGHGKPLQYSCLENSMDGGAWGLQSMGSQRVRHD